METEKRAVAVRAAAFFGLGDDVLVAKKVDFRYTAG